MFWVFILKTDSFSGEGMHSLNLSLQSKPEVKLLKISTIRNEKLA